VRPQAVGL